MSPVFVVFFIFRVMLEVSGKEESSLSSGGGEEDSRRRMKRGFLQDLNRRPSSFEDVNS